MKALTEIEGMLKYLDKAENEINTAEPVSIDPEILTVQLKEHHVSIKDSVWNEGSLYEKKTSDTCINM